MAEVNVDNVTEVMMWAHYFGYDTLVDICASFILKNLNAENAISYMLDARYASRFAHYRVNFNVFLFIHRAAYICTNMSCSIRRECLCCEISPTSH